MSVLTSPAASPAAMSMAHDVSSFDDAGLTRVKTASVHRRNLRISPKKLNDFVRIIRKRSVREALIQCNFTPKKAAGMTGNVSGLLVYVLVPLPRMSGY